MRTESVGRAEAACRSACSSYFVELAPEGLVVAACDCGWRSPPTLGGGMAGSLWDAHAGRAIVGS